MGKYLGSTVEVIQILTKRTWFIELKSVMELKPNYDALNNGIEVSDKHKSCK